MARPRLTCERLFSAASSALATLRQQAGWCFDPAVTFPPRSVRVVVLRNPTSDPTFDLHRSMVSRAQFYTIRLQKQPAALFYLRSGGWENGRRGERDASTRRFPFPGAELQRERRLVCSSKPSSRADVQTRVRTIVIFRLLAAQNRQVWGVCAGRLAPCSHPPIP